jgi:periplasmic divalent cation tolerance protein
VVLVTTPNGVEARKIGKRVVDAKLAACVNIIPGVRSIYRWKDKVCDDQEVLLVIKTTKRHFRELEDMVKRLHSYDTPEIIAMPILAGSDDYLRWIRESTRNP